MTEAPSTQDAASKRRLQNRLNQRASRERKAFKAGKQNQKARWIIYTDEIKAHMEGELAKHDQTPTSANFTYNSNHTTNCTSLESSRDRKRNFLTQLQNRVASLAAANQLHQITLLAPVTNLNTINAIIFNASIMDLTPELLEEDIVSPFNIAGPMTLHLPPSLQPTSTQREIIHHPWIDLMPIQSLREILLKNLYSYDEDELCGDLHGQLGASDKIGLILWGDPWDPAAYEISEAVFKKWSWLIEKCPEIIRTSNHWRRKRGEKPLKVGRAVGFVHPEEVQ
ncbi:hypothetical protein N7520_000525 [Penicillium odoratum]|uniref:uncharacterized protein n=1 Tax=Penicillium odoratum TaxID=1167516 RepID=UPI002548A58F|nr:uncharacterized protein N7520_000525 [Penicillium odoratum]KAJ5777279.1 hypothetical protein N7520_000525 [Penicillium odoratum]